MPGKVLAQRLAVILVLGHLVTLICLSALPARPDRRGVPDAVFSGRLGCARRR
jgi:hypothetical protein